jgi:hypothetical protein
MKVENLVHDVPFAVLLEQGEHVGEAQSGPVVDLEAHIGDRADDVDLGNARLDPKAIGRSRGGRNTKNPRNRGC